MKPHAYGFGRFLVLGLCLALVSCGSGSGGCMEEDTDPSESGPTADDDTGFDDDTDDAVDDDADDDIDDAGPDDDADDDTADDDADFDAPLLIIGRWCDTEHLCRVSSWLGGPEGWQEYPIPAPAPSTEPNIVDEFGPSFFTYGETGYAAWNRYWSPDLYPYMTVATVSHAWLRFGINTGWSLEETREPAGNRTNIGTIFAPTPQSIHAVSRFLIQIITGGFPGFSFYIYTDSVYAYPTLTPQREAHFLDGAIRSFFMPTPSTGLASGYLEIEPDGGPFLLRYDGAAWQREPMPAGLEDGYFLWMDLDDTDNGYAVWKESSDFPRKAMRVTDGVWQELPDPPECSYGVPKRIYRNGAGAVAVVSNAFGDNSESWFWELRDGVWVCRPTIPPPARVQYSDAIVMLDGRVFLAGEKQETGLPPVLVEVLSDTVVERPLPAGLETILALHALGPDAPDYSVGLVDE